MKISVIIVTYNNVLFTKNCLTSVFKEMRRAADRWEVIVVDNGSTDSTVADVTSLWPEARIVSNNENFGYAKAANIGIMESTGEYVLICNNDIVFKEGAIEVLSCRMGADARLGAIGPRVVGRAGERQYTHRRVQLYSKRMVVVSLFNQVLGVDGYIRSKILARLPKGLGTVHDRFNRAIESSRVEWLDGMCVMFRREALEMAGLFDEQFFFDMEIGDLLFRLRLVGWFTFFEANAEIIHYGGTARSQNSRLAVVSHHSNLVYYAKLRPEYLKAMIWSYRISITLKCWWLRLAGRKGAKREQLAILNALEKAVRKFEKEDAISMAKVRFLPDGNDR